MVDLSRVVITGAEGVIGKAIPFGIHLSHAECDVTDSKAVAALSRHHPSAFLHLASLALRPCEMNPLEACQVNVLATKSLAEKAAELKIPLILVSSGAIFKGPLEKKFSEQDTPNPSNIYGQTKYLAELLTARIAPNHLIVRTGWLFGFPHKKDGFSGFIDKAGEMLRAGESMSAIHDQKGSPTYIGDFVDALTRLIRENKTGIIHLVNTGDASAFEMLAHMKKFLKSTSILTPTAFSEQSIPKRSRSEVLVSTLPLRSWQQALESYLKKS